MCATCLVSKTAFCKTFEGSALLSKCESKIDEEHTLLLSCQEGSQCRAQSHPALERAAEILRGPRELLSKHNTAASDTTPSDQGKAVNTAGNTPQQVKENCAEDLGLEGDDQRDHDTCVFQLKALQSV